MSRFTCLALFTNCMGWSWSHWWSCCYSWTIFIQMFGGNPDGIITVLLVILCCVSLQSLFRHCFEVTKVTMEILRKNSLLRKRSHIYLHVHWCYPWWGVLLSGIGFWLWVAGFFGYLFFGMFPIFGPSFFMTLLFLLMGSALSGHGVFFTHQYPFILQRF